MSNILMEHSYNCGDVYNGLYRKYLLMKHLVKYTATTQNAYINSAGLSSNKKFRKKIFGERLN